MKESGSLETLVTTPVLGREYLLGKLMVYLLLGVVGAGSAFALAVFWFRVPFRGSVGLFVLLTADYLFALMGLSLFISNFVASQRTVSAIIPLAFFIPSFFLTGLLLPIDTSSAISQALSYSLPATHYITIARGLALKGIGLAACGNQRRRSSQWELHPPSPASSCSRRKSPEGSRAASSGVTHH